MTTAEVTLPVYGLACGGGGALTVEHSLAETPGVVRVYVNALTEAAYVEYDPECANPWQLMAAIERAGLEADEICAR